MILEEFRNILERFGTILEGEVHPPGNAAVQVVTVRVTAAAVEISPATVPPGRVTFRVTNATAVAQEVQIDGPGEDRDLDDLQPDETRSLTMTLQPGRYEIESSNEEGPDRPRSAWLTVRG